MFFKSWKSWKLDIYLFFFRCGRANSNYRNETCLDVTVSQSEPSCFIPLVSLKKNIHRTYTLVSFSFSFNCQIFIKPMISIVRHPCKYQQIPDDHLAGCHIYPEPDSPRRAVLRPEGAGLPDADFLLYLHIQATDKCRAEVKRLYTETHPQVFFAFSMNNKCFPAALFEKENGETIKY